MCLAEGLAAIDGKLICFDISQEWFDIGKPFTEKAGVLDRIGSRVGNPLGSLDKLLGQHGEKNSLDFAYMDADKTNYPKYIAALVKLLRPGGFIIMDNTI